jgi:signal peptidase I
MMGDNRDNSEDSRYWGFLPRHYVKGKAVMIYWSYEAEHEVHRETGLVGALRRLGSVAAHFFTRTRWERLFNQIH